MKRWFSYIIVFIVGMVLGIVMCMVLAFYNIHKEMGKALIGPRVFGDIRVVPSGLSSGEKTLSLEKDKICFMVIAQDSNGITKHVSTVNKADISTTKLTPAEAQIEDMGGGFMMQPLQNPGDWWCSYGGGMAEGKITGEIFFDFNFDGQFDTRYVYDGSGKRVCWIFLDGDWHKVIAANQWRAKDDSTMFCFDPNSGWLQNDANLSDKQKDL